MMIKKSKSRSGQQPAFRVRSAIRLQRLSSVGVSLMVLQLAGACGADDPLAVQVDSHQQPIIGGFAANASLWDHTGALAIGPDTNGNLQSFCTGTLVTAETVVTAKHCVLGLQEQLGSQFGLFWVAGARSDQPLEVHEVAAVQVEPSQEGGVLGLGIDVAVVHLDTASAIEPAQFAAFSPNDNGRSMISLGYGLHSAGSASDSQRRIGRQTVAAVEGPTFEPIFGDFESFFEFALFGEVTDEDVLADFDPEDPQVLSLREEFAEPLLADHEVVTGLAPGDTQTCRGDSGGPLAQLSLDGQLQVKGVASAALRSNRSECDFGGMYSVFGPDAMAFLEQAVQWEDPCGDVSLRGQCVGNSVVQCQVQPGTAVRQVVSEDCGLSEEVCVVSREHGPLCAELASVSDEPKQQEPIAPSPAQLQQLAVELSRRGQVR